MPGVRARAKNTSRRRASHRRSSSQRPGWKARTLFAVTILVIIWIAWAVIDRQIAPAGNTALQRFDVIVVLGYPADDDGNPTPTQLARVTEAVHEYERGVAPRLILSGAAVANQYVEAQVMARTAQAQSLPASAVILEPNARDTIQNVCYAERIMKSHGWNSAEVISSPSHLPRAGLILSRFRLNWRTHAAPDLQPESTATSVAFATAETIKTMRYLVWARWRESCQP